MTWPRIIYWNIVVICATVCVVAFLRGDDTKHTHQNTWLDDLVERFPKGIPADYHMPGSDF